MFVWKPTQSGTAARVVFRSHANLPSTLFLVGLLLGLNFLHTPAIAGTPTIRVKPKFLWQLPTGPVQTVYDSPEAALSALQDYYAAVHAANPTQSYETVSNLQPAASYPYKTDGVWIAWWWDYQMIYPTSPSSNYSGTTGNIEMIPVCPNAPGWQSNSDYSTSPNYTAWCEKRLTSVQPSKNQCPWSDPIYPGAGLNVQKVVDFQSPNGLLKYERTYRNDGTTFTSSLSHSGLFDYSQSGTQAFGGCVTEPYQYGTMQGSYCFPLMSTGAADALLWSEDGKTLDFAESGGAFQGNPNVNEQVTKLTDAQGQPWWQVRHENNTLDVYGQSGLLQTRTWPDGKTVTFHHSDSTTPAAVAPRPNLLISETDPFGRSLQFSYDARGHMTQMTDPAGQPYRYAYDNQSSCINFFCDRLVQVQYPDQFALQYVWNEQNYTSNTSEPDSLTGVQEIWPATASGPGKTVRRNSFSYDLNGLVTGTFGAVPGDQVVATNRSASGVTITDELGTNYVESFSTLFGTTYTTQMSQPGGSGCNASNSNSVYDPTNGNLLQRDDFDGHRACYAYALRNLEIARVEGLSTSATCSSVLPAASALPSGSRKTSTQWHPDWRLPAKVAEPGRITTYVYNGQPDPFNAGATASCAPSTALLPDGKPIAVLCKKVEQATTDVDGSQAFNAVLDTKVPNRVWTTSYNQYGQVLTAKGPRTDVDDTVTYTYYPDTTATHTLGDLATVKNALGQTTQYTQYDPHGNVLQMIDANNVTTTYSYDLRQRLKSVSVAGATTTYDYWPTGLLKQVSFPDASTVSYTYDDAHRLTDVTDNLGNSVHYTLDNAGNRTADQYKDPSGALKREIDHVIDALGRIQQTTGRE